MSKKLFLSERLFEILCGRYASRILGSAEREHAVLIQIDGIEHMSPIASYNIIIRIENMKISQKFGIYEKEFGGRGKKKTI